MRLFLCEKPSQGKDIGRILGATQRGEGCLNGSGVTRHLVHRPSRRSGSTRGL